MSGAPDISLICPDGGLARGAIACAASAPGDLHSLALTVSRNWVDLLIGTASGDGSITQGKWGTPRLRLRPGDYVLSFTPGVASFYLTFERSLEGFAAITGIDFVATGDLVLPSPYEEDDLRGLRRAQSGDVMWIWHSRHEWRALTRFSNDSWGLSLWRTDDGPFAAANVDVSLSMTAGALRGSNVNIECSRAFFRAEMIGSLMRLTHPGQHVFEAVSADDDWTTPVRIVGIEDARKFYIGIFGVYSGTLTLQRSVGTDYDWQDVGNATAGNVDDGFDNSVIYYRVGFKTGNYVSGSATIDIIYGTGETTGVARVVDIVDEENATVDVVVPFGALTATHTWAPGAWSALLGYPAAGDSFDGRVWLAAGRSVWASKPDRFTEFELLSADDGGINRLIATGDASPVRWVKGAFRLQLGLDAGAADIDAVRITESVALQIRSGAFDDPLTPTNMSIREESAKLVFADVAGARLLRSTYDVNTNSFQSDNLNRLHETIFTDGGGAIDLGYQARPQPRIWAPRADGQLPSVTLAEAEQVVGWARAVLGYGQTYALDDPDLGDFAGQAAVESACVTPGISGAQDSDQDYVHLMVRRVIDGEEVRWHERFARERWTDAAKACFLEAAVRYDGEATRYLYGLDHLFGEQVYVWDGAQLGPFEVVDLSTLDDTFVNGEIGIDLDPNEDGVTVTGAWVGLAMRTRYMSGKMAYGAQAGSAVGEPKKIDHVTMLFHKTALGGVKIGVVDANDLDPFDDNPQTGWRPKLNRVEDLAEGFTADADVPLYTGELSLGMPESETLRDPRLVIEIDGCGPAAILGYVTNLTTQETG